MSQKIKILIGSLLFFVLTACSAKESVIIDAPIEKVWLYVSDSTKARDWSVYFHHITPLPGSPDGGVGAQRRCYRHENESGMFWDEDVMEIKVPTYRQIRTYNIHGYKDQKLNEVEYKVEQLYESLGPNQTQLTFKATVAKGLDLGSFYYILRDASEGQRIFIYNLENIKAAIEGKSRPHPYELTTKWD